MDIMESLKNVSLPGESTIGNKKELLDPAKIIGISFAEGKFTYTPKDAILYALGVGTKINENSLKFLFEGHKDFSVLPTYGINFAQEAIFDKLQNFPGAELINPTQILHGEQYVEVLSPLPTSGTMTTNGKIVDLLDKGKGALMIVDAETKDENGKIICRNQFSVYFNRAGGFGGKRKTNVAVPLGVPPTRAPDKTVEEMTSHDQAALYRLNDDKNPLHIDNNFANVAGFKQPILHGLCSYGFALRHVLQEYANNDASLFKCMKARFNRPVIPGQSLVTEMWKDKNRIHFVVKVKETGKEALTGGFVDLKGEEGHSPSNEPQSQLASKVIFEEIAKKVKDLPQVAKKINGIFVWKITKDGKEAGQWVMDFKSAEPCVYEGSFDGKSDVQLTTSDEDFSAMASGQLNPQQAFFNGKLKIKGNVMLTQKLGQIINQQAKL
ncbi:peroxisomal multifunctional enzyme type 2-like [Rhopilema esculentum]|uniref:peroxisomal multifunctional enzyme type 2-like n=1 Tax=Rhopilema esculentum TaxID=499914 RepID=UPI0031DF759D|eukprot:gene15229-6433_t